MIDTVSKIFTNADQEIVPYHGEPLQWRVSVYGVIIEDGKVLVVKNRTEKMYDIPGGGIELGESAEEALAREMMEEAGASVKIGKLIDHHFGFFRHANGNFYQTLQLFYTATLLAPLIHPTESTMEFVGFIDLKKIHDYPLPPQVLHAMSVASFPESAAGTAYIGVGVGALIINDEGKLLLALRGTAAKNERGKWEIPGGKVEYGETMVQALSREVREEIGVDIVIDRQVTFDDHILPHEAQHWVAATYLCHITHGVPTIQEPEKCERLEWFTPQEAIQLPLATITIKDVEWLLYHSLDAKRI